MKKFSQIILVAIVLIIVSIGYFYQTRPSAEQVIYTPGGGVVSPLSPKPIDESGAIGQGSTTNPPFVGPLQEKPANSSSSDSTATGSGSATVDGIKQPNIAGLNPLKADSLFDLIAIQIPKFLFSIVAALAMLFFTLSAARMLFGASSPDEATKAKQGMTWAIIGMVLAAGSYAILRFIENAIKGA